MLIFTYFVSVARVRRANAQVPDFRVNRRAPRSDNMDGYSETSHSPAECTTLLRWSPLTGTEGSNPSVSALALSENPRTMVRGFPVIKDLDSPSGARVLHIMFVVSIG